MHKVVFSLILASSASSYTMQNAELLEMYKLCQNWFQDAHLRTMAAHVMQLQQRKGSYVRHAGTLEVLASKAKAKFNLADELVTIHTIQFPGVATVDPVTSITFDEIIQIKNLIDLQNRK